MYDRNEAVSIRVQCKDTGKLCDSISSAARRIGSESFRNKIQSGTRTHRGRGWLFVQIDEDYYQQHKHDPVDSVICDKIHYEIKCRITSQGKAIPVYCVERDRYYPSRSQAAADNSMNIETINLAIKEHRKAKGLTFKYVKEVNLNA